ncbi:hypothetical protein IWQ61_007982 [Dispira simplex]|nr:hypothetical protein IWQ61_007982 [Dispira simplex]
MPYFPSTNEATLVSSTASKPPSKVGQSSVVLPTPPTSLSSGVSQPPGTHAMDDHQLLTSLLTIIQRHHHDRQHEEEASWRLHHRLTVLVIAVRKATQLPIVFDNLQHYLQTKQLAPFAQLHQQLGLLDAQLLDNPLALPSPRSASDMAESDTDFLWSVSPASARTVVQLVTILRKHPDLVATALMEMPGHELDLLSQARAGPLHGSLLHTLLFSLYGPPLDPGEDRLRVSLWAPVFGRLIRERKGERFLLKVLELWTTMPEYHCPAAKGNLENALLRILHRAAKLFRGTGDDFASPPHSAAATANSASPGPSFAPWWGGHEGGNPDRSFSPRSTSHSGTTAHSVELNLFYDDTCVDILNALVPFIPAVLLDLSRRIFSQLPVEHHHFASLIIVLRFFFHRYLQRVLTSPESFGLLEDYFVSDQQREVILLGIHQRLYSYAQAAIVPSNPRAHPSSLTDPRIQTQLAQTLSLFRGDPTSESDLPWDGISPPQMGETVFPPADAYQPVVGPILCLTVADLLQLHNFLRTSWLPLVMPSTPRNTSTASSPQGVAFPTPPSSHPPDHLPTALSSTTLRHVGDTHYRLSTPGASCGRLSMTKELKVYQSQLFGMLISAMKKAGEEIKLLDPQSHTLLYGSPTDYSVHLSDPALGTHHADKTMDTSRDLEEFLKDSGSLPGSVTLSTQTPIDAASGAKQSTNPNASVDEREEMFQGIRLLHDTLMRGVQRYHWCAVGPTHDVTQLFHRLCEAASRQQDYSTLMLVERAALFLTRALPRWNPSGTQEWTPLLTALYDYYRHLQEQLLQRQQRRRVWQMFCGELECRLRTHLLHRQSQLLSLSLRGFYIQVRQTSWFNESHTRLGRWSSIVSLSANECREVKQYLSTHKIINLLTGEDRLHRVVVELLRLRDRALPCWNTWINHGTLNTPVSHPREDGRPTPGMTRQRSATHVSTTALDRFPTFAGYSFRDTTPDFGVTTRSSSHSIDSRISLPRSAGSKEFPSLGLRSGSPKLSAGAPPLVRHTSQHVSISSTTTPLVGGNHVPTDSPNRSPMGLRLSGPSTIHSGHQPVSLSHNATDGNASYSASPSSLTKAGEASSSVPASPAFHPGLAAYFNPLPSSNVTTAQRDGREFISATNKSSPGTTRSPSPAGESGLRSNSTPAFFSLPAMDNIKCHSVGEVGGSTQWWTVGWSATSGSNSRGGHGIGGGDVGSWSSTNTDHNFSSPALYSGLGGPIHYTLLRGDWQAFLGMKILALLCSEYLPYFHKSATDSWIKEYLQRSTQSAAAPAFTTSRESTEKADKVKGSTVTTDEVPRWKTLSGVLAFAFDRFRSQFHLHSAPLQKLALLTQFESTLAEHLSYRYHQLLTTPNSLSQRALFRAQPPGADILVHELEQFFKYHRPRCFLRDLQLLVMVLPNTVLDFSSPGKALWDVIAAINSIKYEGIKSLVDMGQRMLDMASKSRLTTSVAQPVSMVTDIPTSTLSGSLLAKDEVEFAAESKESQLQTLTPLSTSVPNAIDPRALSPRIGIAECDSLSLSSSVSSPPLSVTMAVGPLSRRLTGQSAQSSDSSTGSYYANRLSPEPSSRPAYRRHDSLDSEPSVRFTNALYHYKQQLSARCFHCHMVHADRSGEGCPGYSGGSLGKDGYRGGSVQGSTGSRAAQRHSLPIHVVAALGKQELFTDPAEQQETKYQLLALRYFSIAAREGNAEAQRELGILYLSLPHLPKPRAIQEPQSSSEDTDGSGDEQSENGGETISISTGMSLGQWLTKANEPAGRPLSLSWLNPLAPTSLGVSEISYRPRSSKSGPETNAFAERSSPIPSLKLCIPHPHLNREMNLSAPISAPPISVPSPPRRHYSRDSVESAQGAGTLILPLSSSTSSSPSQRMLHPQLASATATGPTASHLPVPPTVTPAIVTTMSTPAISSHSQGHPGDAANHSSYTHPSRASQATEEQPISGWDNPKLPPNANLVSQHCETKSDVQSDPMDSVASSRPSIDNQSTHIKPIQGGNRVSTSSSTHGSLKSRGDPSGYGGGFMSTSSFRNFFSPIVGGSHSLFSGSTGKSTGGTKTGKKKEGAKVRISEPNPRVVVTESGTKIVNKTATSADAALDAPANPIIEGRIEGKQCVRTRSNSLSVSHPCGTPSQPRLTQLTVGSALDLSSPGSATQQLNQLVTPGGVSGSGAPPSCGLHRSVSTHGYHAGEMRRARPNRSARPPASLWRDLTMREGFFATGMSSGTGNHGTDADSLRKNDSSKVNPENIASALYWFRQAADQGDALADRYLRHRDGPLSLLSNLPGYSKDLKSNKPQDDMELASAASASAAAVAATSMELTSSEESYTREWNQGLGDPLASGIPSLVDQLASPSMASGSLKPSLSQVSIIDLNQLAPPPMAHSKSYALATSKVLAKRRTSLFTIPSAASSASSLSSMSSSALLAGWQAPVPESPTMEDNESLLTRPRRAPLASDSHPTSAKKTITNTEAITTSPEVGSTSWSPTKKHRAALGDASSTTQRSARLAVNLDLGTPPAAVVHRPSAPSKRATPVQPPKTTISVVLANGLLSSQPTNPPSLPRFTFVVDPPAPSTEKENVSQATGNERPMRPARHPDREPTKVTRPPAPPKAKGKGHTVLIRPSPSVQQVQPTLATLPPHRTAGHPSTTAQSAGLPRTLPDPPKNEVSLKQVPPSTVGASTTRYQLSSTPADASMPSTTSTNQGTHLPRGARGKPTQTSEMLKSSPSTEFLHSASGTSRTIAHLGTGFRSNETLAQ